ncbi:MAG: hypothetical protein JNL57_12020, partial [Bacteroidetes bacterium]|nr:hypothetical protein [Bacteroidota bacterium]
MQKWSLSASSHAHSNPCGARAHGYFDYTSFGSTVKERTISYTQKYRFGFNNQEQESELGDYYSFEYRVHDTRLSRFLSVDPLAPQYPWNSTYAFAENRVIDGIDLEGREWQPVNDKGEACAQSEATDYLYVGFTYTANGWIAPEGTVSTATINAGGYTLQYNSSIQNNWVDKSILSENLSP